MSKILIIAAEASSVLYAEQLIQHWSERGESHSYFGVGSRDMAQNGFKCFGFAEEMAVMGFSEVLSQYSHIKKVFHDILSEVDRERPEVAVLIDYPGFNLRLSEELHQRKIPVVYYISPQIWAWKKKRVFKVKAYVTKMLVVFPFEVDFYRSYSVPVEYVGHPLLDELRPEHFDQTLFAPKRGRLGVNPGQKVLGLMPGSRKQEVERHLQIQLRVAEQLRRKHPDLKVLLLLAPTLSKEFVQSHLDDLRCPVTIVQDQPFNMIYLTDAVLVASGTATLMVGLLEKPMVIMYKVSWLSAFIGRRLVKGFFGLVNLLSQREIVPEIFQERATPEVLVPLVERSLFDESYRQQVIADLKALRASLGEPGVTARVAQAIGQFLVPSSKGQ